MIRIEVEEYCDACMDFSPDVSRPSKGFVTSIEDLSQLTFQTDTIIRCEYRKRCDAIKKYLMRQARGEEAVG